MDPITAIATAIAECARALTTAIEGQPPEVRRQMWDWYIADVAKLRAFFKMDT